MQPVYYTGRYSQDPRTKEQIASFLMMAKDAIELKLGGFLIRNFTWFGPKAKTLHCSAFQIFQFLFTPSC